MKERRGTILVKTWLKPYETFLVYICGDLVDALCDLEFSVGSQTVKCYMVGFTGWFCLVHI